MRIFILILIDQRSIRMSENYSFIKYVDGEYDSSRPDYVEIIEDLLYNIHNSGIDGWTILSYAVYKSNYDVVEKTLKYLDEHDEIADWELYRHVHPSFGNILKIAADRTDEKMLKLLLSRSGDYVEMLELEINSSITRCIFETCTSNLVLDLFAFTLNNLIDNDYLVNVTDDDKCTLSDYINERFMMLVQHTFPKAE